VIAAGGKAHTQHEAEEQDPQNTLETQAATSGAPQSCGRPVTPEPFSAKTTARTADTEITWIHRFSVSPRLPAASGPLILTKDAAP
jgi:hypothetical protein